MNAFPFSSSSSTEEGQPSSSDPLITEEKQYTVTDLEKLLQFLATAKPGEEYILSHPLQDPKIINSLNAMGLDYVFREWSVQWKTLCIFRKRLITTESADTSARLNTLERTLAQTIQRVRALENQGQSDLASWLTES
jgi:hypothetical protein